MLLPHGAGIGANGYAYNLGIVTAGNIVGGAGFVGVMVGAGQAPAQDKTRAAKPRSASNAASNAASNERAGRITRAPLAAANVDPTAS
jgi:hypothetical protein